MIESVVKQILVSGVMVRKHIKQIGIVALAGLLLASVVAVQAGGPPWSAWLYAPDTGQVVMAGADGSVLYDFALPLPQGFDGLPGQIAVARGGTLLAYVARNSDTGEHQLRVYDVVGQNARVAYNLPAITGDTFTIWASELNFNSSDSALAYGYALTDGGWEVIVVDTFLGDLLYQLRSDNPVLADQPGNVPDATPFVQRFDDDSVLFTLSGGATYRWSLPDGTVTYVGTSAYPGDMDTFAPTGETVMALDDPALPGPSLQVYDPATGTRFPFYNEPEVLEAAHFLQSPRFVQNGERVAVLAGNRLRLLERDGSVVGDLTLSGMAALRGLTDGLVFTLWDGTTTSLIVANTRDSGLNQPQVLWSSAAGELFQLAWVQDRRLVPYGPYLPWAHLGG
ncbi:MAG: hypothetical protein H6672_03355 [Anaerolineaceae bacterium]|nr:hypothetical protein [Anaerolineaceae bacterium]